MKKVLLVEDDRRIALAFGMSLQARGYEVVTAGDVGGAVAKARSESPDVVVLDINLPGGDGFDVANELRAKEETAGLPILFITASEREGLWQRAAELGATHFLEKPFGGAELAEAIEAALEKSNAGESAIETEIHFR